MFQLSFWSLWTRPFNFSFVPVGAKYLMKFIMWHFNSEPITYISKDFSIIPGGRGQQRRNNSLNHNRFLTILIDCILNHFFFFFCLQYSTRTIFEIWSNTVTPNLLLPYLSGYNQLIFNDAIHIYIILPLIWPFQSLQFRFKVSWRCSQIFNFKGSLVFIPIELTLWRTQFQWYPLPIGIWGKLKFHLFYTFDAAKLR